MKITIKMSFQGDKNLSEEVFETDFETKDNLFANASRINTILTAMLESGIISLLGNKFIDAKNKVESRQENAADSFGQTVDAAAGQSPYGFRKGW